MTELEVGAVIRPEKVMCTSARRSTKKRSTASWIGVARTTMLRINAIVDSSRAILNDNELAISQMRPFPLCLLAVT